MEVGAGGIDGIQQRDSVGIDVDIAESKGNITLSKSKRTIIFFHDIILKYIFCIFISSNILNNDNNNNSRNNSNYNNTYLQFR